MERYNRNIVNSLRDVHVHTSMSPHGPYIANLLSLIIWQQETQKTPYRAPKYNVPPF